MNFGMNQFIFAHETLVLQTWMVSRRAHHQDSVLLVIIAAYQFTCASIGMKIT